MQQRQNVPGRSETRQQPRVVRIAVLVHVFLPQHPKEQTPKSLTEIRISGEGVTSLRFGDARGGVYGGGRQREMLVGQLEIGSRAVPSIYSYCQAVSYDQPAS